MHFALFCLCALTQDPAPVQAPDVVGPRVDAAPARPWRQVDRVVMVVNNDIITESELMRRMVTLMKGRRLTPEEQRQAEMQILGDKVRERLRVQAGSNLGVDEKLLDARVRENIERLRERQNGVVGLAQFLESKDVSGPELKKRLRDELYDQIYREGVTGEGPGPLGRVTTDRYVRPGQLRFMFDQARPDDLKALGGSPSTVRFHQMVLDVGTAGGKEAAREVARAVIARLEAGEEWTDVARSTSSARETEDPPEVEEARLRELYPEIAEFVTSATPGQISTPIEGGTESKPVLRIVRFEGRTEGRTVEFSDFAVQEQLRKSSTEMLEQYRLETSYKELLRSSYVWPPEVVGRSK
jgi:peptidyl-prolyl cis-trans isomerase SurA